MASGGVVATEGFWSGRREAALGAGGQRRHGSWRAEYALMLSAYIEEALEVGLVLTLFEAGLGSDRAWFGCGPNGRSLVLDGEIRS